MKRVAATMFIAFFAALANAQAYKCVGPGGKVSFQEKPCATGEKGQELDIQRPPPLTADEQRMIQATATGGVTRGMTAKQVRYAWGAPTKVNKSVGSYGTHEQWVYHHSNNRSQYVYLENGIVTAIQTPGE